jgi:hypothetical protein
MSAIATQDSTPSAPSTSQIPDLIRIGSVPDNTEIDVETSILEPVSFSQSQCHFVLANKGILHSNSRITFANSNLSGTDSEATRCFFPPGVGVHTLIQRARLAIGGKTVSEVEDFNHFMAYESLFIANETQKEREQVLNARCMSAVPTLNERVGLTGRYMNASNNASNQESTYEAKSYMIDNGKDFDYQDLLDGGALDKGDRASPSRSVWDYQEIDNKPIFSILLADLFPFLKSNQLPLYMIDEQVSITLTFEPQHTDGGSARVCITETNTTLTEYEIDQNHVKLIADYIYYPQEMMEQYRAANSTMNFTYVDYQFAKRTVAAADMAATGGIIQNLGGAGRIVNKVFVGLSDNQFYENSLLNQYHAKGPEVTAVTAGQVTTNLRYNDLFLFPIDVTNKARHFHNVFSTEGRMPMIPRGWFGGEAEWELGSSNGAGDTAELNSWGNFEAWGARDELASYFFWTAYRLNRNERVNSRGIELYDQRVTNEYSYTLRAWLQIVRIASLSNGVMTVTYA